MAKPVSSVIGVDLGRHALKSVLLQRRGPDRVAVTHYAARELDQPIETAEHLSRELKALFKELGGSAKTCAVAISSGDSILRIIEQPETPARLLREALRLNGMSLLNQDCRDFIIDCDLIASSPVPEGAAPAPANGMRKYLVGGLRREQVGHIAGAIEQASGRVGTLQLAPVCVFNAFEFAQPEIFNEHAFFLVDIGHTSSTMIIGVKRELFLVRSIDFGGKGLFEALVALSGEERDPVLAALEQGDELMVENARLALTVLCREVGSSIGFFEGRREETITRVFVSGGPAKSQAILQVMSEEIHMPCAAWNPLEACEMNVPAAQRQRAPIDELDLHVAYGAAMELLNS